MSNKSDHNQPQFDINQQLPEVYKSDVNESVFDVAFNRHLTKDDTVRVAGFVGVGNPQALVDRQIKEPTPHRQAYQLAPTMYTKVGTQESALSYKAFEQQLKLMGVNVDRLPLWGNALQFNWVPPVNVDMLINYSDYFWSPAAPQEAAQYITIESQCQKAQSKHNAYSSLVSQRGDTFTIVNVNVVANSFNIVGDFVDMFAPGFAFFTKSSNNVNVSSKFWTVVSSTYVSSQNQTVINCFEPIAFHGNTPPAVPYVGQWWLDTSVSELNEWTGSSWVASTTVGVSASISMQEMLNVYMSEANCACNQDFGWDTGPWDDNQIGNVIWNQTLLAQISHATEADWVAANGPASQYDLWYDTTTDVLYQRPSANDTWVLVVGNFSSIIAQTTGQHAWDMNTSCVEASTSPWTDQNRWVHKSEVKSFATVRRATMPILEYDANVELNEWVRDTYSWKYRALVGDLFNDTTLVPSRLELEPIRSFSVSNVGGVWEITTFDPANADVRDVNYTSTFVPGFKFRIVDDDVVSDVYTVDTAEYREMSGGYFATVIRVVGTSFPSPIQGGGATNVRIEPLTTSTGDTWRGYHIHWLLDTSATSTAPSSSQPWNIYRRRDQSASVTPTSIPQGLQYLTSTSQEWTIQVPGITSVTLDATLTYVPGSLNNFATAGGADLRVYVNGIRQYGTYSETTDTGLPAYTMIGEHTYNNVPIVYVTGVTFDQPLSQFDTVRIEVGCASREDMGYGSVPVRTIEDEAAFALATANGTQPVYRSLTQHRLIEQVKTQLNQYPLFNTYNVVTGDVVAATPLFGYSEDSTYPVNTSVQRRIVASTDGKEYQFTQFLTDRDDNLLYGYRNTALVAAGINTPTPSMWWFSPIDNMIRGWDGKAWSKLVEVTVGGLIVLRSPIISSVMPVPTYTFTYWFNPTTSLLQVYDGSSWSIVNGVHVGADPSIQTVWKHGTNFEQYVPRYVDANRNEVTVGSSDGDWQLPDQWMFNTEHHNRVNLKYSELYTHFASILAKQQPLPGLPWGSLYTFKQQDFNYGLGGTIKEYNDSFDTLVSAVNVSSVTPTGVIEFAEEQYAVGVQAIRDGFMKLSQSLLSQYAPSTLLNQQTYVSDAVIDQYESNEFFTQVFGDSSAYDASSYVGVKHWVATAPMFGLSDKYRPHVSVSSNGFVEVFHHDGHRSQVVISTADQDRISRAVCSTPDARGGSTATLGLIRSTTPPVTASAVTSAYGVLRTGVYWYQISGGQHTLYRFQPYAISSVDPSNTYAGATVPDRTLYLNTTDFTVREKAGVSWSPVSSSGDVSLLWVRVDLQSLLAHVMLDVEQRLYDVTPNYAATVFDYNTILAEPQVYASYDRAQFDAYVTRKNIKAPLINTTYAATNAFTWNYVSCVMLTAPFAATVSRPHPQPQACWQQLYTNWYGTPYPHLEPWKLQGYRDKPTWWDATYRDTTSGRSWIYTHATATGMWENIRVGIVPAGQYLASGGISTGVPGEALTYEYFSVNIGDTALGGYAPDALLPPYFDNTVHGTVTPDPQIRSLFASFSQEIVAPDADYAFGDGGPTEWMWSVSLQHVYDKLVIAYKMQPIRFMHYAFGPRYVEVDGLQVETVFKHVYSHKDALFHGDLYNTNRVYEVRGLNQWYVNYNRYVGYDTNTQFRQEWVGWAPLLTYQFAGITDTSTFEAATKYFDINAQDYNIMLANSGVIRDLWADAFEVSVLTIPPSVIQYNPQSAWKLEIDSLAAIPREITYYGVKSYPFFSDRVSDLIYINRYAVVGAEPGSNRLYVTGNQVFTFTAGVAFTVTGSSSNDNAYTVVSSVYEPANNRTRVNVAQMVVSSAADGYIDIDGVVSDWDTGDVVVLSSTKTLPAPLAIDTPYYMVRVSDNVYKLAETYNDALSNLTIDITTNVTADLTISQIKSSFRVFGGAGNTSDVWFHYALNKADVRTFTPPMTFYGMQSLINIIDGYAEYQQEQGLMYGVGEMGEFDPNTGRMVDWQVETERFIDWAYGLRRTRLVVTDKYAVATNVSTSEFTFVDSTPVWPSGTRVVVGTTGSLPSPLQPNTPYYVQQTSMPGTFKLSTTSVIIDATSYITVSNAGSGSVYVSVYNKQNSFPSFEINATRNSMWIDTPTGMLANVIEGPYADIRVQQTIFDQYSRPLKSDKLTVYRRDKVSKVVAKPQMANDVDLVYVDDPYNYIHFGGAHMFLEGFEHYLIFNNYTVGGNLVYDSFLGLNTKRFNVDYYEKHDYSLRPTLGGFYLLDQQFSRNIEGSADDMRHYYDPYGLNTPDVAQRAHALIGYTGTSSYLDLLNVNDKSQIMFYRGMLQSKGSINSIKAYINSRRFVDAKMDEFWAWKLAEFGDARPRVYPEIKLFSVDGTVDDVRLEFLANSEQETDPAIADDIASGFKIVSFRDATRWVNSPEQKADIVSPLFLDAEVTSMTVIYSGTYEPTPTDVATSGITLWFNGYEVREWDTSSLTWSVPISEKIVVRGTDVYYKHDTFADAVRVLRRQLDTLPSSQPDFTKYATQMLIEGTGVEEFTRVNSNVVRFTSAGFTDVLVVFTINPSKHKISPAKLVDTKAGVVLQNLPLWHPALGYHYHVAEYNITTQTNSDPAKYQVTANPYDVSTQPWNNQEVGTVWLDTAHLGYMPYYDAGIYPNVNDRLYAWGKLAPWASVHVYQWVQSTIPPSQWDTQALSDSGNSTIAQNDKVTGTPKRTTFKRIRTAVAGVTALVPSTLVLPVGASVQVEDEVLFTTTGTLPTGLQSSTKYVVETVSGQQITIADPSTGQTVVFTDSGTGTLTLVPAFKPEQWIKQPIISETIYTTMTFSGPYPTAITSIPLSGSDWRNGDIVDVYINGGRVVADATVVSMQVAVDVTAAERDVITVVRPVHVLSTAEQAFDPDLEDDGTEMVQWKEEFEYTIGTTIQGGTNTGETTTTYYYFWVQNATSRNTSVNSSLSVYEIAKQIETIPIPYFVVQKPMDDPALIEKYGYGITQYGQVFSMSDIAEQFYVVPVLYRQAVLRNVASYLTDDDRYIVRFIRDLTLRDDMRANGRNVNLKEKHEQWFLFRQQQPSTIPQELWNRLTEAMMGQRLSDSSVRVPSLDRELYDATYGTDTRFGLGVDQAFVDKTLALATVIAYLQDSSNDFYPANIDDFFARNAFDTPAAINQAMVEIYNTFPAQHVNAIWFNTLADALSTRAKYKELMKTSWIALHGIKVLEVGGLFDD